MDYDHLLTGTMITFDKRDYFSGDYVPGYEIVPNRRDVAGRIAQIKRDGGVNIATL